MVEEPVNERVLRQAFEELYALTVLFRDAHYKEVFDRKMRELI